MLFPPGLNFPDISLLEGIAGALDISVVELLGIEEKSREEVVNAMSDLSKRERDKICRELCVRGWITVIFGIIVWAGVIYASKVLADHGVFGSPQAATAGMPGCIGVIVANGIVSIRRGRKLAGRL